MREEKTYMGYAHTGDTFHDLGPHPRKELLKRLGRRHVSKIYVDRKAGGTYHVGYIIGGLWITLYEVRPFRKEA